MCAARISSLLLNNCCQPFTFNSTFFMYQIVIKTPFLCCVQWWRKWPPTRTWLNFRRFISYWSLSMQSVFIADSLFGQIVHYEWHWCNVLFKYAKRLMKKLVTRFYFSWKFSFFSFLFFSFLFFFFFFSLWVLLFISFLIYYQQCQYFLNIYFLGMGKVESSRLLWTVRNDTWFWIVLFGIKNL